ncbi:MAG: hypothetical protein ACR2JM_09385, partial [Mycobacterium sp.]
QATVYVPAETYAPQPAYTPTHTYAPEPAYTPTQTYTPQPAYTPAPVAIEAPPAVDYQAPAPTKSKSTSTTRSNRAPMGSGSSPNKAVPHTVSKGS